MARRKRERGDGTEEKGIFSGDRVGEGKHFRGKGERESENHIASSSAVFTDKKGL